MNQKKYGFFDKDRFLPVSDLSEPALDIFTRLREPQLYHYHEPAPGLFLAEGDKVARRALDSGYKAVSVLAEERAALSGAFDRVLADCGDIPVYTLPFEEMKELTGYSLTGGFLCAMRRRPLPDVETICADAARIAVLENITNPTNVGAIIRSAAALSVGAVALTRDSCDPLYRRSIRVSMGTVFQIPWTVIRSEWPEEGIALLHGMGFITVALALTPDAMSLGDPALSFGKKAALIFGAEGDGLSPRTVAACDKVVRIPMRDGVDSLNVAAASAVAFWEFSREIRRRSF